MENFTIMPESIESIVRIYAGAAYYAATETAYTQDTGKSIIAGWIKAKESALYRHAAREDEALATLGRILYHLFDVQIEVELQRLEPKVINDRVEFPSAYAALEKVSIHWPDGETGVVFEALAKTIRDETGYPALWDEGEEE